MDDYLSNNQKDPLQLFLICPNPNFSILCFKFQGPNYQELVNGIVTAVSTNSYSLLVIGVALLSIATVLLSIAIYHRRKINIKKTQKTAGDIGFHRYSELVNNQSDEESNRLTLDTDIKPNKQKYLNDNEAASKKLLDELSDEEEQNYDKIFVR